MEKGKLLGRVQGLGLGGGLYGFSLPRVYAVMRSLRETGKADFTIAPVPITLNPKP